MLVGDLSEEASGSRFCCIDGWSDGCLGWWLVGLSRTLYRPSCRDTSVVPASRCESYGH